MINRLKASLRRVLRPARSAVFLLFVPGLSTAGGYGDAYSGIAASDFAQLQEVQAATVTARGQGFHTDGPASATMIAADCSTQVCQPTFLVAQTMRKTDAHGYTELIIVSALMSPSTHFGTGGRFINADALMKAVAVMERR
jgi:hypothetical protein